MTKTTKERIQLGIAAIFLATLVISKFVKIDHAETLLNEVKTEKEKLNKMSSDIEFQNRLNECFKRRGATTTDEMNLCVQEVQSKK